MCSIVGLQGKFKGNDLIKMLKASKNRGPDSTGIYLDDVILDIDLDDFCDENNISKETMDLLCWIDYNYWASPERKKEVDDIKKRTGIPATVGIGTNMYLAKIAMDIGAKKTPADKDGFRIAETDLQLRGPGDLEGLQQSGLPFELKIASLTSDGQMLDLARRAASDILEADPLLSSEYNRIYKERLDILRQSMTNWGDIS